MALDKRQKILLPLIILAFAYIAWQIYDLFFVDLSAPKETSLNPTTIVQPTPIPQANPAEIQKAQDAVVLNTHSSSTMPSTQPSTETSLASPTQPSIFASGQKSGGADQSAITAEQSEYLRLVNRYNLLKLKHLLLEEEAAIAAAKHRIVKSRSEITSMGGNAEWEEDLNLDGASPKAGYELVYLDYQKGRWNALLNRGGRFFEVHEGMQLMNGDRVVSVGKEGVVINHNNQLFQVTFDGSRLLSENEKTPNPEASSEIGMTENEIVDHVNAQKEAGIQVDQATQLPGVDREGNTGQPIDRLSGVEKRIAVPFQDDKPMEQVNQSAPQIPIRKAVDDKDLVGVKVTEEIKQSAPTPMPQQIPQKNIKQAPVQKPVPPAAQVKASKTVEKAQKWFSGIWSNQASKKQDANVEILRPSDEKKPESKKTHQPKAKPQSQPNLPKNIPEPAFLNSKQAAKKPEAEPVQSPRNKVSESFGSLENGKTDTHLKSKSGRAAEYE